MGFALIHDGRTDEALLKLLEVVERVDELLGYRPVLVVTTKKYTKVEKYQ